VTRLALEPELAAARAHAGAALTVLEAANAAAGRAIDPGLARSLERRVAGQLGAGPEVPSSASPPTVREQACFEFADQFVAYVPGITAGQRDAVAAQLGQPRLLELARMLYVFDMTSRLRLSLGHLFEPAHLFGPVEGAGEDGPAPVEERELGAAIDDLHAAAMQLSSLDPVTTELVRLHCARYHDCKT